MAYSGPPNPTSAVMVVGSPSAGVSAFTETAYWPAGGTMFALAVTANQPIAVAPQSSDFWSEVCRYGQGVGGGTTSFCIQLFKKNTVGHDAGGPQVSFSVPTTNHFGFAPFAIAGEVEVALHDGVNYETSATGCSWPSVTTPSDNCLVLHIGGDSRDSTAARIGAASNAALTSLTEVIDAGVSTGNGSGMFLISGRREVAGATGSTTATLTTGAQRSLVTVVVRYPQEDEPAARPTFQAFIIG